MARHLNAPVHPALPTVVERLTIFLRRQPHLEPTVPILASPEDLAHVLDELGHHVAVLTLVARADDNIVEKERKVFFRNRGQRAAKIANPLTDGQNQALRHSLEVFSPPLAMLENAL